MKQLLQSVLFFTIVGCSAVSVSSESKEKKPPKKNPQAKYWSEKVSSRLSSTKRSKFSETKKTKTIKNKKVTSPKKVRATKKSSFPLPLSYGEAHFRHWIQYFTKRSKARFTRHMSNAKKYEDIVRNIFAKHGLPKDLFYVGLIESGYNTKIKSRASAVGPWQFVRGTAKMYGLRIDRSIDERFNIFKSTEAAAQYFKDLYNIFGSWELALCAYNKGEYGIIRAIRKGNTRNYKELIKKGLIPKETVYYIPKLAAARAIYQNPKKYSMPNVRVSGQWKYKNYSQMSVRGKIRLSSVAKQLKVSHSKLKQLNPDFKWKTVSSYRGVNIHFPASHKRFTSRVKGKRMPRTQLVSRKSTRPYRFHRVKRGENLGRIARRYKTTVSKLKALNKMRRTKIYVGQKLRVPLKNSSRTAYVVKRGDNLLKIARRFNVGLNRLVRHNGLKSRVIFPQQKLFIPI